MGSDNETITKTEQKYADKNTTFPTESIADCKFFGRMQN